VAAQAEDVLGQWDQATWLDGVCGYGRRPAMIGSTERAAYVESGCAIGFYLEGWVQC
jgi:hypothetical protein